MLQAALPLEELCEDIKRHIRTLTGVMVDDLQVQAEGHQVILTGRARRFFNKQQFDRKKDKGVTRVFCLGGSTTFGRPYDDLTSFCGWLRELLPVADPSRKWELINAGGISYASYRVAALMEELSANTSSMIKYEGYLLTQL